MAINDKNIISRLFKLGEVETDSFVNAATNAVSTDGRTENLFRDNNSKAREALRIVAENQTKIRATNGLSGAIGVLNASSGVKSVSFCQHKMNTLYHKYPFRGI